MREKFKIFSLVSSILAALFGAQAKAACPDATLGETALDCPWSQVSRELTGVTDFDTIKDTLNHELPGFLGQIEQDSQSRGLLNLWGLSRNIDQSYFVQGLLTRTIPTNLLAYFKSVLNVQYDSDFIYGHAGMNHTYGYLFSILQTPYGYKRARFVSGENEAGFGLPDGVFNGTPPAKGTLLSNFSYFIGSIAFRDNTLATEDLNSLLYSGEIEVTDEIVNYDYSKLPVKRIVEIVENNSFYLEIRTDIVSYLFPNAKGTDTGMLIYSIDYHEKTIDGIKRARPRLITAFPVLLSSETGLFNPKGLGPTQPITLNFNAALPVTIPADQMVGKRYIFDESTAPASSQR